MESTKSKKYLTQTCYTCRSKVPYGFTTCMKCEHEQQNWHRKHMAAFEKEKKIEKYQAKAMTQPLFHN